MPVEFLGMGAANDGTEAHPRTTAVYDPEYAVRLARAHEDNGWDHVLFAYGSGAPDPVVAATWVAAHTDRIQLRLAHRPNTSFPTVAAKAFQTLDVASGGRLTVHVITGGDQADQEREGDTLTKDERYRRTREFLQVVRRVFRSEEPFDHHGEFYDFTDFVSHVQPGPGPLLSFGGSSAAAWDVGAAEADVYCLFGEPLADAAAQQRTVLDRAAFAGRRTPLRWQIAFRPIVAATDDLAWEKAHTTLARISDLVGSTSTATSLGKHHPRSNPQATGAQRLLEVAARGERHDRALWTPTAGATGAAGSSTALVGSYETVAAALLDYVDLGFEIFGLRGYDFLSDAQEFGRHVIPLVRQEVAHRERALGAARARERQRVLREQAVVREPLFGTGAVHVRALTSADVAEVQRTSVAANVDEGQMPADDPYSVTLGRITERAATSDVLVATDDRGTVVGTVTVVPAGSPFAEFSTPGEEEVRLLAVDPPAKRRGVARALLDAAEHLAAGRGAERLVLRSAEHLAPAHDLYLTAGYTEVPERGSTLPGGLWQRAFVKSLHRDDDLRRELPA